jgi:hypothetical protein
MKFNNLTYNISIAIISITALYTLIYSGLTGVLLSASIALIAAAFLEQFEIVVAVTVIFALFYTFFLKRLLQKLEPFENGNTPVDIRKRIAGMESGYSHGSLEPTGVYDSAVEGFEDVNPTAKKEGTSSDSTPASTKIGNAVNPEQVKEVTAAIEHDDKQKTDKKTKEETTKEEFESATNSLFKLGKMPSENKDGPLLDSGSTLLKAMETFKPEQITAMTSDTKQLLETQKNLMGMLNQMRPVLADGKELLQTFTGMFGGGGPFKL